MSPKLGITDPDQANRKHFEDALKGKKLPRDIFGRVISIGDYIAYGTGARFGASINFGRVVKINYNRNDEDGVPRPTSITLVSANKNWRSKDKFERSPKKRAVQAISETWILDHPPQDIVDLLEGD